MLCLSIRFVKHNPCNNPSLRLCYASAMARPTKNPHAAALGRLGGKASMDARTPKEREEFARMGGTVGGKARAKKLSESRRKAIAKKAAEVRWGKKGKFNRPSKDSKTP